MLPMPSATEIEVDAGWRTRRVEVELEWSPSTNTLPIRRLGLAPGDTKPWRRPGCDCPRWRSSASSTCYTNDIRFPVGVDYTKERRVVDAKGSKPKAGTAV